LNGQLVSDVHGVVTAVSGNGYWIQNPTPDADPATSEGLFVFARTAPTVHVGDDLVLSGTVSEFRPGGATSAGLTTTQLTGPTATVRTTGVALPAPVVLGVDRVAPQQVIEAENPGSVENAGVAFRPDRDAIDFSESLEGMRVAVRDAQVVGPTSDFGEIPVVPGQSVDAVRSIHGGVVYSGYDHPNAMRVQLDDLLIGRAAMPAVNVGDRLPGDTVGVLDYSFNNYKLEVTAVPAVQSGGLIREVTTAQTNNQLAVATFNVENLASGDSPDKYAHLAGQIVHNLASPDILALEEIQDNNGAVGDAVVDSTATSDKLLAAIAAAGGPAYAARWVNPQDDRDGGQPGGNIRQVFIYRLDRDLTFVDRAGTTNPTTTAAGVTGTGKHTHLTLSPGRINPASSAWTASRKPLVGEFTFRGRTVFAIANHFNSKGGDDPLSGRFQQPQRSSEVQRHQQAGEVRAFVDQLVAADPQVNVVVLGDINDFEFSRTADILVGSGPGTLLDLPRTLPAIDRYTYVFEGNSQVLDHILISRALTVAPPGAKHAAYEYDVVHTNSEFADQDSDHDPQVVRLAIRGGRG
jgi:predicted extracellular nuclease